LKEVDRIEGTLLAAFTTATLNIIEYLSVATNPIFNVIAQMS